MRWVRRPLLPVMRLWRRNIQLRVVATTLLMSLGVVLLLGFVVIGQVRNGLLDAKVKASQSQATGGFAAAKQNADEAAAGHRRTTARPADGRAEQNVIQWMSDLVELALQRRPGRLRRGHAPGSAATTAAVGAARAPPAA